MSIFAAIPILMYLTATMLLGMKLKGVMSGSIMTYTLFNATGLLALTLHATLLYSSIMVPDSLDLSFSNAVSLVGWSVALIVMITAFFRPLENLLLVLFPVAAVAIVLEQLIPHVQLFIEPLSVGLKIHILLSICAYSLLMISALQAIILAVQEKMIKTKHAALAMNTLPPLQVMEKLLIQFTAGGYFLLNLSLISGLMFIDNLFAQHLAHKTVFTVLSWLIYSVLLWGVWHLGWRGKMMIRCTIGGFMSLLLAYFGTKFVLEFLL